jgi:geranylgeranyl pyrophosphate synthase
LIELLEAEFAGAGEALEHGPFTGLDKRHLESSLLEPLRDFFARPGKEFRARLVECAYSLAGGKGAPPVLLPWIVEILHAGSLIVDDIEDGSTARRGEPALHVRYGLPLALNAGNWLYFWAESLVERLKVPPSVELSLHRTIQRALLDCHRGQALDLTLRMSQLVQAEVPVAVATTTALKTGRLMELAASLGAITAGAPAERVAAIGHFASDLGTALQMLDDVGGLYSMSRTHKGHEDLRLSRPTWPWAWLAETLPEERYRSLRREALEVEMGDRHPEHLAERLRAELGSEPKARPHERSMRAIARLRSQLGNSAALRALCAEIGRLERSYD